jgi:hypothetical protein
MIEFKGKTMGDLQLTPPVDESISELARRTARIGEEILVSHGATDDGRSLQIPIQDPIAQPAELFKLADLMQYWNPDWTLERAGFGGAGGGMPGIRGITYLDGPVLATYPRDEIRGTVLRRTVNLGSNPSLVFKAGVDAGRAWQLLVYVDDKKVLDKLINGLHESHQYKSGQPDSRRWEDISIDLSDYKNQKVVLRLYQRVLVPRHEAGDAYWRDLTVQ